MMEIKINEVNTSKEVKILIGWKHFRPNKRNNFDDSKIGTRCEVMLPNSSILEETKVHPKDQFCKSVGRKESLKKCIEKLNVSKSVKKEIWKEYFKHFPIKKDTHGGKMATK